MKTKRDREKLLDGVEALLDICLRIARESHRIEQISWKGRPFTVSWQLYYSDDAIDFEPSVHIIPQDATSNMTSGSEIASLSSFIECRLERLKDDEEWPSKLKPEWLEEAASLVPVVEIGDGRKEGP
jgi:hypothetical protein